MEELKPGECIDAFKITKVLHVGEMARVYRADDLFHNQDVVLKIPLDDILNRPILYYQHQNEERISRYLDHPRIVRFLRRDRSGIYLVMECIAGENLRKLLNKKKKLSLETACRFSLDIAEGLEFLHDRSIIHLDLKPDNIMVTPEQEIKIIDFGLANHLAYNDLLAYDLPGPKGTPYYIAPEQLCGSRVYKQSDIYSLGILLYEMLTGQLPFKRSKKISRVRERLKREPIPPRYFDPDIPSTIQEVILTALEKNPLNRYSSIKDFTAALKGHADIPVTFLGKLVTKPLPFVWFFKQGNCSPYLDLERPGQMGMVNSDRQVLGCIFDHDSSDLVIEQLKREALLFGGDITLLTVVINQDSELEKYATAVEGRALSTRLDRYIALLKRYDIEPTLRIRKGNPVEVITNTAKQIKADTIILGPPRAKTGLAGIFAGSTIQKIMKLSFARVVIADAVSPAIPPFVDSDEKLTPVLRREIDLFFTDIWVHHLNWFSHITYSLLKGTFPLNEVEGTPCAFEQWLAKLPQTPEWAGLVKHTVISHKLFHQAVREMVAECENPDLVMLHHQRILPLATAFKEELKQISKHLSLRQGEVE